MLSRLYQTEPERLPLPDESFLERNGLMKLVKTACCVSLSMDTLRLPNAWMLKFERKLLTSKQLENCRFLCNLVHFGANYQIFTYTVWYVWQLKFLELRQNRKLGDAEARNGPSSVWNQNLTKASLCSCAWLKFAILSSPRASRAGDMAGLLLLGAYNWKITFGWTQNSRKETPVL